MGRIFLDTALLVLLLLLMGFQLLPKPLHEVLGLFMAGAALLHLAWNRAWVSSLARGQWDAVRAWSTAVNAGLFASFAVATVSGLAIAQQLFRGIFGLAWERSILAHQAHTASAYWLLVFVGLHLGAHWRGLWARVVKARGWDVSAPRFRVLCRRATITVATAGVCASFLHRVGDRLLMRHFFGTAAARLPLGLFLLSVLAIVGLWAVVGAMAGRKR